MFVFARIDFLLEVKYFMLGGIPYAARFAHECAHVSSARRPLSDVQHMNFEHVMFLRYKTYCKQHGQRCQRTATV
jgi:hypothetical protein